MGMIAIWSRDGVINTPWPHRVKIEIAKLNQMRACLYHLSTHGLEILRCRGLQPKHKPSAFDVPLDLTRLLGTHPPSKSARKVVRPG